MPGEQRFVVMTVEHELGTALFQCAREGVRVGKPAPRICQSGQRRMMDENDADRAFIAEPLEQIARHFDLMLAELARGDKGRRFHSRVQSDERQRPDPAHERKRERLGLSPHIGGPALDAGIARQVGIDVVIAGNDGDALRRADAEQPLRRGFIFRRKPQVDEIAGDGDVIGAQSHRVRDQPVGDRTLVHAAPATLPVQIPECALGIPIARRKSRHGREVYVGKMR